MKDTIQQTAFLDKLVNTNANLALVARAGCGKTSTILRGVDEYSKRFPHAEILVCAYNKSIADEVSDKLKARGHTDWRKVQASTLHSLGFSIVKSTFNLTRDNIDDKKVLRIIERHNDRIYAEYTMQIAALVGYAKGSGVGFFNDLPIGDVGVWHAIADHYDVNGLEDTSEMDAIVEAAQCVYRESLSDTSTVDFDDMILFPLIKNIRVRWGKDLIFLDEAQDLSRARQALARKFLKYSTGRMVVVGDDRQAIYGFSGADAAALDNLISGLGAVKMPLTVTWRCPKRVVELAQTIVPDITAAPSASDGSVDTIGYKEFDALELRSNDVILCRNTAPLISIAYKLIRKGVACKVEGRSIGEGLMKLVNRWKVRTIDALLNKLDIYRMREIQKAQAKGDEAKVEQVNDKCETLKEICTAVTAQQKHSVDDVREFISNLFADDAKGVLTLATYHRSKGREWPRVILWEHYARCPSRGARQDWQRLQESNLAYVAFTRAQQQLVFVQE